MFILHLNKIDLLATDRDNVVIEIEGTIGLEKSSNIQESTKTGIGITNILKSIITNVPHPVFDNGEPFCVLVFESKVRSEKLQDILMNNE